MCFHKTADGYVNVWTDGACSDNGYHRAKAGVGVFFGENNRWNLSEPVIGRATSNVAEIQAVIRACEIALEAGISKLQINTDSTYVIDCESKWFNQWQRNNWIKADGDHVANVQELVDMIQILGQLRSFRWNYVRSHQGKFGNSQADELARQGAERYRG